MIAKGYTIGVFIDIEGVFDNTLNTSIKEVVERHKIPEARGLNAKHAGKKLTQP